MSTPEIAKLMILSTLHIKPTTSAELDRLSCDELPLPRGSYDEAGHFLYVPNPDWEPVVLGYQMFKDLLPVFASWLEDHARILEDHLVLMGNEAIEGILKDSNLLEDEDSAA